MSKHVNPNHRPKVIPPAGSELRVTIVNARDASAEPAKQKSVDKELLAMEIASEHLREQRAQMKTLTDACAAMGHASAEYVRKAATARFPEPAPRPPKAPPPVSTYLRRFTHAIAEKVTATTALLTDDQRTRIGAIIPGFTCATLGNEPDVVALVVRWMELPPEDIARELAANLEAFERRFAS
jgi:hypothetical protein